MKKILITGLVAALFACGRMPLRTAEEVYRPELLRDMEYGVVLDIDPAHYDTIPERMRLEIKNGTGQTIRFGAEYGIERYDEQRRVWVEYGPPAGTAFIQIIYTLEPGKTQENDIGLFPDKIGYTPGSYRVTKRIHEEDGMKEYSAPFILKE